jgi:hypothetical protein
MQSWYQIKRELQKARDKNDATIEWMKFGALKGIISQTDADGNVTDMINLFTELDVVQQTHDMELSTTTTDVPAECRKILRKIESELGAYQYESVHAFAGADFIDALLAHDSVHQYVLNWQDARFFREEDLRYGAVRVGNIIWEEYRGVVGGVNFIEADEAWVFPIGVPDMFKLHFAPANYVETVNTIGLFLFYEVVYAKLVSDQSPSRRQL